MDRGTPDLFGYVRSSKPKKTHKGKATVSSPIAEPYFVVYAPGWKPVSFLAGAIVAFISWYVFGAQLTDVLSIDAKELPGPLYGTLVFIGLIAGVTWASTDLFLASSSYFQANPERRIFGRYRSRAKAWSLRISIPIGCTALILLASVLTLHGYWNARSVAIMVSAKLLQPPRLTEELVDPPVPLATVARPELFGPPAPPGSKLAPSIETGSIPIAVGQREAKGSIVRATRRSKRSPVKEVDPLSKSIKTICDWFERTFGLSTKQRLGVQSR